ncbi:hypothetical protein ACFW0L_25175 [Priestia megaterium]|uniref:hypothetical protein n=1 Tax=Priestia megaterium TaxID=1404 RepID=UPI00366A80ED
MRRIIKNLFNNINYFFFFTGILIGILSLSVIISIRFLGVDKGDFLAFLGSLIGGILTVLGVYLGNRWTEKQFQQELRVREVEEFKVEFWEKNKVIRKVKNTFKQLIDELEKDRVNKIKVLSLLDTIDTDTFNIDFQLYYKVRKVLIKNKLLLLVGEFGDESIKQQLLDITNKLYEEATAVESRLVKKYLKCIGEEEKEPGDLDKILSDKSLREIIDIFSFDEELNSKSNKNITDIRARRYQYRKNFPY